MQKKIERHRYKDNVIFETRTLVFEPYSYSDINLVISLIQLKLTPDLLSHKRLKYRQDLLTNKYYGHCYHATQALYYLIDTDRLVSMKGEDYRGESHWWLQDQDKIYDVTADQYYSVNETPPYEQGKKTKWYGWKQRPQQITLELMKRVLTDQLISDTIKEF
tara:strand:+ start:77 stop:562 length:486 start_codon:yes stop_codon:yes gene_type:complete